MPTKTFNKIKLLLLLTLTGCTSAGQSLPAFNHSFAQGTYQSAKEIADQKINENYNPQHLLWNLQAGSLDRILKNYNASNTYFDRAENYFNYYDQQITARKVAQTYTGLLFNDSALPYIGKNHDRIMVNTYKALNFATIGDMQNARIEFNRALKRQNDAKTIFHAQAQDLKNQLAAEKANLGSERKAIETTLDNPQLDHIINSKYKNLQEAQIFSDYINPFTTYIAGLFFWLEGDNAKAVDILKEAYAMSDQHPVIANDFFRASRGEKPANKIWIIYENGLAPQREAIRIDVPIVLDHNELLYIATAFPNLTSGQNASLSLQISTSDGDNVTTQTLTGMDSMIIAEFKKELPGIITREVARTALKTYFQYEMRQKYGELAGIASGIYQAITTGVDIRSWSTLPKNFQLAQVAMPRERKIILTPSGDKSMDIIIPSDCNNVILYIRIVAHSVEPIVDFIKF